MRVVPSYVFLMRRCLTFPGPIKWFILQINISFVMLLNSRKHDFAPKGLALVQNECGLKTRVKGKDYGKRKPKIETRKFELGSVLSCRMNYLSVYNKLKNNGNIIRLLFELDGRPYSLERSPTDSVGKTLKRIGLSVIKATKKRKSDGKKKGQSRRTDDTEEIQVQLFDLNGEAVNEEISNLEAWNEGNVLTIAKEKFLVEENPPIVQSAWISSVVMAGFPVVPLVKLEFSDELNSQYRWFKQETADMKKKPNDVTPQVSDESEIERDWTEVGQEFVYVPKVGDIGCPLKFSCKAASAEKEAHKWYSVVTSSQVSANPGLMPFETRQLYTARPISDPSTIRIVSYNILADCYLEDDAICEAWFGYCPRYALAIDYRQQLSLKEILGYNGDIICLQECGRRLFKHYLCPAMKSKGYTGVAMYKTGVMAEGETIFFKESRFTMVSQHDVVIKDCFLNDPINRDLLAKVKQAPKVFEKLSSRSTVAQLIILQSTDHTQEYICLVNTHLYFHPSSPFIRNLQAMTILNFLNETVKKLDDKLRESSTEEYNIGIIFCGDFNSLPGSGVVELMCGSRSLEASHPDWVLPQEAGEPVVDFKMCSFQNPFDFQNCFGFPEFTTYTEGFKGTIDYIFATKNTFEVQAVIPMPMAEELQAHTAIPSPVVPSDHLALVCELKWRKK